MRRLIPASARVAINAYNQLGPSADECPLVAPLEDS